jgi:hypothetical protein
MCHSVSQCPMAKAGHCGEKQLQLLCNYDKLVLKPPSASCGLLKCILVTHVKKCSKAMSAYVQ